MGGAGTEAGAEAGEAAALEHGRWLFAQPCDFVLGAAEAGQLPPPELPEVAFAGRSNVGKSSLINALTARKTLARISNTPGQSWENPAHNTMRPSYTNDAACMLSFANSPIRSRASLSLKRPLSSTSRRSISSR